ATDAGSPASGIATVTANVSSLTPGTTSLPLPACTSSCSVGGVTYGHKSAATTAGSAIADGSASVSLTAADKAGNTGAGSASVTIDSTAPAVTAAIVVNTTPSDPGYLKPGNHYVLYANAADTGGLATVTADLSALTSGQTAAALSACTTSYTFNGVTYGWKSASKTAGASIAAAPAAFSVTATDKAANATTAAYSVTVDATGPTVSGVAVANTTTNAAGWLRKSGAYVVYANASDPTGISSVKANVTTFTSGVTALALSACTTSCTVGGVTYGYKSASKTAGSTLAAGAASFTVTATDGVGNTTTANGSATVDNAAPTATAEAIAPTATNMPGYIAQGATYIAYTNAADAGGVYSVTAKVSNITTGQTALALPACVSSCTIAGAARGYASAALAANPSLTGTSKTWTVTVTDLALRRRVAGRLRHRRHGRHLRHGQRRNVRPCQRPGQHQAGLGAGPLLEPGHELVLVRNRGADAGHRHVELVARGRLGLVHQPDLLHDPGVRHGCGLEHHPDARLHHLHVQAVDAPPALHRSRPRRSRRRRLACRDLGGVSRPREDGADRVGAARGHPRRTARHGALPGRRPRLHAPDQEHLSLPGEDHGGE